MGTTCGKMFKSKDKRSYSEYESNSRDHAKKNIKEEKSNSKSCEMSSILFLPEDLMIDIFNRVSLKCLFNSAMYVCKSWATIISSSKFAKVHNAHSIPGLYVVNRHPYTSSYFLDIKDDLNGNFKMIDLEPPTGIRFLVSTCDGILLLWDHHEQVFIVNPILKSCLRLPALPITQRVIAYNFVLTHVPHTAIFKVFYVDIDSKGSTYHLYIVYVLEVGVDNSWNKIVKRNLFGNWHLQLVYSGGNDLYLITTNEVIVMDVDNEITVEEYPLPYLLMNRLFWTADFLWMDNRLSFIICDNTEKYQIYIFDIESRTWTLYHEMGPFDFRYAFGHKVNTSLLSLRIQFWMKGQFIFALCLSRRGRRDVKIHFVYDIKTRKMTKIKGIFEGDYKVYMASHRWSNSTDK